MSRTTHPNAGNESFGPNLFGVNHGTPAREGAFVPAQEVLLGSDGSVSTKKNFLTVPGGNYTQSAHAEPGTEGKYLESW